MIRFTALSIALLFALPVSGGDQSVLLGVGTENLLYDIEDPAAFFAYRERLDERRDRAAGERAKLTAFRPPARGALAVVPVAAFIAALPNRLNQQRQAIQERVRQQRELIEEQERIARAYADRLRTWAAAVEKLEMAMGNKR